MTKDLLRVGVVGAGMMGRNHARVYSSLKGVELVAVVDTDPTVGRQLAEAYGCKYLSSKEEIVGIVDAVSIAVPSASHADVGVSLLEAGIHCLVEKPLAPTGDGCDRLRMAAQHGNATLMAGHVERFNPAVQQMMKMVAHDRLVVHAIDARRMSAVSSRITDVDVVMDLMIHDIDIIMATLQEDVIDVTARGVRVSDSGWDHVTALLQFKGGAVAALTASRITQNKVRELHVTTNDGLIVVDYTTRELLLYRQGMVTNHKGVGIEGSYILDLAIERVLLPGGEPLVLELQHFVDCLSSGEPPMVTAEAATQALRVGWEIHDQLGSRAS